MTLLRLLATISLHKINGDNLNERDDFGVPFSEKQYMRRGLVISLCLNTNPLISLIPRMASKFRHLLSCGTIERINSARQLKSVSKVLSPRL